MTTLKELKKQKNELETALSQINKNINKRKSETLIQCTHNYIYGDGCGAAFKIKDIDYIQTHYYIAPYGCSGGDYWKSGEGNFICPACGHRNRMYDREDFEDMKYLFKSVIKEYKE